jgi:hypothetical protein
MFSFQIPISCEAYSGLKFRIKSDRSFNFVVKMQNVQVNPKVSEESWNNPPTYSQVNAWQEITFNFTEAVQAGVFNRISLLPAAYQNKGAFTFYIDDVELIRKDIPNSLNRVFDKPFSIYPTVVSDVLNIEAPGEEHTLVSIHTLTGQPVYSSRIKGSGQIAAGELGVKGMLFVRLANSRQQAVEKVIFQ